MTFRARLVMAATTAVVFAVVMGSVAAYVVSYNSLVGSIDLSLSQTATELVGGQGHNVPTIDTPSCSSPGVCGQVVQADGTTVEGTLPLPVTTWTSRPFQARNCLSATGQCTLTCAPPSTLPPERRRSIR